MPDDKFGIKQIYPTAPGGDEWFLSDNPNNDSRLVVQYSGAQIKGNPSLPGFHIDDQSYILEVATRDGLAPRLSDNLDHALAASQGYMWKEGDWRDVEITGHFDLDEGGSDLSISLYARGHFHPLDSDQYCPGTKYQCEIGEDGRFRFSKEQFHKSYSHKPWQDNPVLVKGDIRREGVFGFKLAVFNVDIGGGKQGVKLEAYVDGAPAPSNTWIKIGEIIDKGDWGSQGAVCGGAPDQIMTWGGPIVSFRMDDQDEAYFMKLSVRDISTGSSFDPPTPAPPPPTEEPTENIRVVSISRHLYRVGTSIVPTCKGEIPTDPDPPAPDPPGAPAVQTLSLKFATGYTVHS